MAVYNLLEVLMIEKFLFWSYLLCSHLNKNHKSEKDFDWEVFIYRNSKRKNFIC